MKLLLRRIFIFIVIPILLCVLTYTFINFFNNRALNNYKVKAGVKEIYMGDSHIQLAIDDKLIANTVNLSQQSESYKFTYLKIQALLKNNPSINKVYLGFSYHNLASYYDDFIDGKYSKDICGRFFFIAPYKQKVELLNERSVEFSTFVRCALSYGLKNVFVNESALSFIGLYQNDFKKVAAIESSMNKRLFFQFYKKNKPSDFSTSNINYFNKIIEFCKLNSVEIILINTPLHPYFKNRIPLKFIAKYDSIIAEKHLSVLDFSNLVLSDSCFIPDGDHLSAKGAGILSRLLNEKIMANIP